MRLIHAGSFTFALVLACVLAGIAPASQVTTQANGSDASEGRAIFRFDTFGDEQLWTTVLRMHDVLATVSPETALSVGLKVDVEALPRTIIAALRAGDVDLTDPAVTVELLRLNAVKLPHFERGGLHAFCSVKITRQR